MPKRCLLKLYVGKYDVLYVGSTAPTDSIVYWSWRYGFFAAVTICGGVRRQRHKYSLLNIKDNSYDEFPGIFARIKILQTAFCTPFTLCCVCCWFTVVGVTKIFQVLIDGTGSLPKDQFWRMWPPKSNKHLFIYQRTKPSIVIPTFGPMCEISKAIGVIIYCEIMCK